MLTGIDVPIEVSGIVVAAFDVAALREFALWRRLVRTSLPDVALHSVLIAPSWSPRARRTLEAVFSPSDLGEIRVIEDPEGTWASRVGRQADEATFAAVVRGGVASLVVVGGPTDAAWDQIEAAVQAM